jgi:hypothetical protein
MMPMHRCIIANESTKCKQSINACRLFKWFLMVPVAKMHSSAQVPLKEIQETANEEMHSTDVLMRPKK